MTHYRVREFLIPGPKPPPQMNVKLKEGEKPPTPPMPPAPLKRYRMVEFMYETGPARDMCDHEHVSRADADKCPVAWGAMKDAGYVGEVDDKALAAAKAVKDLDERV